MKHQTTVRRILTNAAKLVERSGGGYSCVAITTAAERLACGWNEELAAALNHYQNLFSPHRRNGIPHHHVRGRRPFGSAPFWDANPAWFDYTQDRVNALLFAAASYE